MAEKVVAGARESRTLARLRPMAELCGRLTGGADGTSSMSARTAHRIRAGVWVDRIRRNDRAWRPPVRGMTDMRSLIG
jgi:hypothetical protein